MNRRDSQQVNGLMIELTAVTKVYGAGQAAVYALRSIDLGINQGEFVAVMGPSGSGKSTCTNILGCLDTPTSGAYLFKGLDVAALTRNQRALLRRRYLGFVFQGYNLLNRTSALENVELPLLYRGVLAGKRRVRALQALESVGLTGWESHTPGELSGGQQQRVAIARAIVTDPAVLFADEPTGALDRNAGRDVLELLRNLVDAPVTHGPAQTVVMVTHDPLAASYADNVLFLADGRIVGQMERSDPARIGARMAELEPLR